MLPNWLRNQLTPEKRDSELYGSYADILQAIFENEVVPILNRISSRRSFFSMTKEDLDTRMSELGRFFRILSRSDASKPIILQQRLDEIHYKGTDQPIISTIRRELNNLPATWAPVFAPVDQVNHPYGAYFTTEDTLVVDKTTYGEFFMTSRGRLKIPLNILYERYTGADQSALVAALERDFDDVIRPLIPLEIVFDGFMFYLEFDVSARLCEILLLTTQANVRIDDAFKARNEQMGNYQINATFPGQNLPQQPRDFEINIHRIDGIPIDAWALDLIDVPVILPSSTVPDTRYRESANHKMEIDTLGMFGIQVAMKDGSMTQLSFTAGASTFEVPVAWADRLTIEKITYRFY